jgi:hypothetical protein
MDIGFSYPGAMIDYGEQDEPTWPDMRFHFFLIRFPTLKPAGNVVDHHWLFADFRQQGSQKFVETFPAFEADTDTVERNYSGI